MTLTESTSNSEHKEPPSGESGESETSNQPSRQSDKETGQLDSNKNEVNIDGSKNKVVSSNGNLSYIEHQEIHVHQDENLRSSRVVVPSISIDENLPQWFASLDAYGKYYAIGVCFFHQIRVADFLTVLPTIRNYLIRNGDVEKKSDAPLRHLGVETVEVRDPIRRALVIQFATDTTAGEILTLLKQKYSSYLFNFVSILDEVIRTNPNNWELRWRSAAALGQISELDIDYIYETVISDWIEDDRAYVRAAVGYYLYYILDQDNEVSSDSRDYVLDEFKKLANPKNFKVSLWKRSWTAVSSCEKLGLLKNDATYKIASNSLEELAGINYFRIADSVIHALVEWSVKGNFEQALDLLIVWAERGSAGDGAGDNPYQVRCVLALLAFSAIVEVNYDILCNQSTKDKNLVPIDVLQVIWDSKSGNQYLWNGIVSIGIRYFDFDHRMRNFFFEMIENWAEVVPNQELFEELVSSWLAEIYFNVRSRTHLENRLKNIWMKGKNAALRTTAEKVQQKIKKGI